MKSLTLAVCLAAIATLPVSAMPVMKPGLPQTAAAPQAALVNAEKRQARRQFRQERRQVRREMRQEKRKARKEIRRENRKERLTERKERIEAKLQKL